MFKLLSQFWPWAPLALTVSMLDTCVVQWKAKLVITSWTKRCAVKDVFFPHGTVAFCNPLPQDGWKLKETLCYWKSPEKTVLLTVIKFSFSESWSKTKTQDLRGRAPWLLFINLYRHSRVWKPVKCFYRTTLVSGTSAFKGFSGIKTKKNHQK